MTGLVLVLLATLCVLALDRVHRGFTQHKDAHQYIGVLLGIASLYAPNPFAVHAVKFIYMMVVRRYSIIALDFHVLCFWWLTGPFAFPENDLVNKWMFSFDVLSILFLMSSHVKKQEHRAVFVMVLGLLWFVVRVGWFGYWCYEAPFMKTWFIIGFFACIWLTQLTLGSIVLRIK